MLPDRVHSAWPNRSDYRRLRHDPRRDRKAVHSAGILAHEITVTYPFHPLTKQCFVVMGEHEHYGAPHVLVRGAEETRYLLPAWMTTPEAGSIEIVAAPRLSVTKLVELRELLDRTMIGLSSREQTLTGGHGNGKIEESPSESVRGIAPSHRVANTKTRKGIDVAGIPTDRSTRKNGRGRGAKADSGGRQ